MKTPIEKCLISPNESDSNFEAANVVDGLFFIGRAIHRLADVLSKDKVEIKKPELPKPITFPGFKSS